MNKTLSELIKERNLDYVNKHITEENFPLQPIRGTEYKLFHFDRYMSSEEVISEIESEGYLPANIYELLNWGGCGGRDYVASLGSFAKVDLDRYVPGLWSVSDRHRLYLYWFDNDWLGNFRFLGIKPSKLETEVTITPTEDVFITNVIPSKPTIATVEPEYDEKTGMYVCEFTHEDSSIGEIETIHFSGETKLEAKVKLLEQLITERKLDYVSKHITEENFPLQPIRGTEYKLFHFVSGISSEEVISEMGKEGYLPANIYELLSWDGWNVEDYVIVLGSVAKVGLDCRAPGLWDDGVRRKLDLSWFDNGWGNGYRFLGIKPKESETEVRTDDISNTNEELLDNLVRDITKVGSISKSEARARIKAIIRDSQLTGSVETKDGNYAVINGKKYKLIEA